MKIAIIGRTEVLYNTAINLKRRGHEISCILTSKAAPEYTRTENDFKMLAEEWDIPFEQGSKIEQHIDFLTRTNSDLAVSINYSGVIPQTVIDLFTLGILNAHGGDLPRYRGNACQAWAILNGENRIGLCIHKMIGGELDSGDIIAKEYFNIDLSTKITEVWDWITICTPNLIEKAVDKLQRDSKYVLEKQSLNPEDALRCYPRIPDDGKINWSKSSIEILRLINASNKPYSGAYCYFEEKKITIWDAELVSDFENFCAIPGQVTKIGENFIEVACGIGKIRLFSIEFSNEILVPSILIKSIRKRLN